MGCQLVFNAWDCLMQHLVNWSHEVFRWVLVPFGHTHTAVTYVIAGLEWWGSIACYANGIHVWLGCCCTTLYSHEWLQCAMCKWGLQSWNICTNWFNGDWSSQPWPTPHGCDPMTLDMEDHYIPISCPVCKWVGSCCVCPLAQPFLILPLVPWWDNRLNEKAIVFETGQCVVITYSETKVQQVDL